MNHKNTDPDSPSYQWTDGIHLDRLDPYSGTHRSIQELFQQDEFYRRRQARLERGIEKLKKQLFQQNELCKLEPGFKSNNIGPMKRIKLFHNQVVKRMHYTNLTKDNIKIRQQGPEDDDVLDGYNIVLGEWMEVVSQALALIEELGGLAANSDQVNLCKTQRPVSSRDEFKATEEAGFRKQYQTSTSSRDEFDQTTMVSESEVDFNDMYGSNQNTLVFDM